MECGKSIGSNNTSNIQGSTHFCGWGLPSPLRISWTELNLGRRFFGCANYGLRDYCNFFAWFDPPIAQRSAKIINALLRKKKELKEEIEAKNIELLALQEQLEAQRAEIKALGEKVEAQKNQMKNYV